MRPFVFRTQRKSLVGKKKRVQGSITENPLSSTRGAGWILEKLLVKKLENLAFLEEFLLTIVLCFNIKDGKEKHGKPILKKKNWRYISSPCLIVGGDASWNPFWMAEFVNQQFAWFFMRSWSNSLGGHLFMNLWAISRQHLCVLHQILVFLKITDDFMMIIILILIVIKWSFRQGLGDNAGWTSTAFWWIEPWFLDCVGNAVNFLQMWWLETCKRKNMKFEWEKKCDESLVDLHGWESFDVTQELHVLLLGDRTEPTKEGLMGCACYEPLGDVQTIDSWQGQHS